MARSGNPRTHNPLALRFKSCLPHIFLNKEIILHMDTIVRLTQRYRNNAPRLSYGGSEGEHVKMCTYQKWRDKEANDAASLKRKFLNSQYL